MKKLKLLLILALVICISATIVACNKTVKFKIDFIVDDEIYQTLDTSGNEVIQMPEDPTKDGYAFDGWYWDKDSWGKPFTANSLLAAPLSSNMAVYAKFSHIHSDGDWELTATVAATEDEEGNNTYRCKVCGETKQEIIEKLEHAHNYANWKYDETWHWRECLKDGEKNEITEHTYGDWKITIAPTCTQNGLRERVCTICGRKAEEDVSAKGHTEVVDNAVEATCTETGLTEGKHCSVCNTVLVKQNEVLAKGHTEVVDNAVEPTCTETGLTEGKHCSVCNTVLVKQNVVAAKGHTEVIDEVVEPTCDKQGKTEGKHCSVCGTVIVAQQEVKKLDHTYDDGVITKEATEFEYGKKRYTCTACGHYYEVDIPKLIIDRTGAELISANGFTIDGNSCSISLPNTTTVYSFIKQITVSDYATWTISTDIYGMNNVATKTIPLNVGDNVVYLLVTSGDGNNINLYTMTVRRRPIYTVNFVTNGGTSVDSQDVEETYLATEPTTTRAGYTFVKWNYDFTKPIMKNETISASWRANTDTAYKTEYYLQNLTDDNYTLTATDNLSGTTDTTARAEIKSFEHFTYNSAKSTISGNINGNGNLVLKVYYMRDKYDYSVSIGIEKAGTINCTANGKYKYDTTISLSATVNAGYDFVGWFDGENKVSDKLNYEFNLTKNISLTAKWYIHTDTAYKTEYYLQNLEDDNYTLTATDDLTGTTDTTANAVIKSFEHFTYNAEMSTVSGNIDGNGNLVLKVYYTRDKYTVSVFAGNNVSVTNAISGKYKYGYEYTGSVATFNSYLGYEWDGWYVDGVKTYDVFELNAFTITRNVVVVAQSKVKAGMQKLNFTSTATTCIINGVKDKTITNITVPDYVTEIKNAAFKDCNKLIEITLPFVGASRSASNGYDQVFGYIFGYKTTSDSSTVSGATYQYYKNSKYYYYYIPSSLQSVAITGGDISPNVFYGCSRLTSVTIPDSVTSIGSYAFYGCSGLTSITIPDSVTSIGVSAFKGCSGLISITIPDSVTSIGSNAFYVCSGLTSITIPDSVTSIGECAFYGCSGLTSITIPDSVTSIGSSAFEGCSGLTSITIPDSVTSIGKCAFYGCRGLTSITIPDSVTSIGECAFYGCRGLTSITIPDSVKSIGSSAFSGCTNIETATIPTLAIGYIPKGNLKTVIITSGASIGNEAFYVCSGLTSVTIGNSVTSISSYAFYGCSGLTSIYYTGDIAGWCGISGLGNIMSSSRTLYIDGKKVEGELIIPDGVTSIGSSAFEGCRGLTSITIPDSVKSIGSSAFSGCTNIETATIPTLAIGYIPKGNLKTVIITSGASIGDHAFYNCSGLTSVTIGNGVTSIGEYAFSSCSGLTSITIPDSVKSIGSFAFYNCSGLTSITIGNSVTSIGGSAFEGCNRLTSINVSENNSSYISINGNLYSKDGKTLVRYAIGKTDSSFTIPDSVTSIGDYAFCGCSGLTSVTIGNGVTSIGEYAFSSCSGLTSITIGNSVTSIGEYAFSSCSGLTSITITDSVTSIGDWAFCGCSGLTSINVSENNSSYKSINGNLYSKDGKTLVQYAIGKTDSSFIIPDSVTHIGNNAFYNCSGLTSITIGNGVTSIGDYAFLGCTGLTSITIPDSVRSIGEDAFRGCSGLTSVTIGNGVTSIGEYTFAWCSGLTSVTIGNGVKSIGYYAFSGCSGLTSITIPDSVTRIGNYAFFCCYKLVEVYNKTSLNITVGSSGYGYVGYYAKAVYTEEHTSKLSTDENGYIIYTDGEDKILIGYTGTETELTLPEGITEINQYAFRYSTKITKVIIPDSVTSIGNDAFYECSGLTSITIPDSVTSIGSYAFYNCSGLTSVTIPDSVTSIGDRAFYNCSGLTSVTIGNGVKRIGDAAFSGCSGLTSITIPDSVTRIGDSAFFCCYKLVEVYNKSSLNITVGSSGYGYVGYYAKAVYTEEHTSKLSTDENGYIIYTDGEDKILIGYTGTETELTLPEGITEIYKYAFYNCSGLTSITIGNSVTSIGERTFSGCSGLTSIKYGGTKEQWQAISKNAYWNQNTANYVIYCTDGTIKE